MPHLWRHPNGVFYIVWQDGAEPRRRSTGSFKRVPAERALKEFILEREQTATWGGRPDLTMHEACEDWLEQTTHPRNVLARSTISEYRTFAQRVSEFFPPQLRAADVTPRDVRGFVEFLERRYHLSPQGIRKRLGRLSMVFRFQIREGNLGRNPAEAVRPPKAPNVRTPAMTEERFLKLLEAAEEEIPAGPPKQAWARRGLRDALEVLWLSGLRSIELMRMEWEDVDLEKRTWTVRSPKEKGGHRLEPIHSRVVQILRWRLLQQRPGPFYGEREIRKEWKRFKAKREEWEGTSLHSLRHGFVTRLAMLGNPAVTKYLAGHATDQMSAHYTHIQAEDARPFLEQLSAPPPAG